MTVPQNASEARLLANIERRAERLFEDGYLARRMDHDRLSLTTPRGITYELDARAPSCTCPFFTKHEGRYACKHLLGAACLLQKQTQVLRHNRREWEALA